MLRLLTYVLHLIKNKIKKKKQTQPRPCVMNVARGRPSIRGDEGILKLVGWGSGAPVSPGMGADRGKCTPGG